MLGKKDKKEFAPSTGAINVIGEGTRIMGDISSNGDLRIDGTIEGNVLTSGKCVLGITGAIKGNIDAKNADISGQVQGDITIKDLLLVKSSGKVNGDIKTSKIVVENGGEFNGGCVMGNAVSIAKEVKDQNGQTATT
ncbi:MAG: polymer-forming cytoskeletal protein [Bacteroidia bacterium]|mgnify:CR=1 FL=1|jgi:cytoskeletal protein CcmA (bactofilin family)|tara:strand:+ start:1299 stop:1709 length:411 start_codon:yes stop_codon:yes gene_type:complete